MRKEKSEDVKDNNAFLMWKCGDPSAFTREKHCPAEKVYTAGRPQSECHDGKEDGRRVPGTLMGVGFKG